MLNNSKNKIMIAILDENYYFKHQSYPEEYNKKYVQKNYLFDTPEDFIKKWLEIEEGAWYWVFVNDEEILSGAIDPDDIETFEEYFNMTF